MQNLRHLINNFAVEESGQDLVEYALVAALVGLGVVASMKSLSTAIGSAFNTVTASLTSKI